MDGTRGSRVLVVDDNRDLATATAMVLRHNGHVTATAFNGRQAIEQARSFQPSVVLLDIGLPDHNGYEVARILRKELGLDQVTIIAASAWDRDASTPAELSEMIDDYITKPVNLGGLLQTLRRGELPRRGSSDGQVGSGAASG